MKIQSKNFKIEGGELWFLCYGNPVKWGDVVDAKDSPYLYEHAYVPAAVEGDRNGLAGCGIMTAETCTEIAGLLKQLDDVKNGEQS